MILALAAQYPDISKVKLCRLVGISRSELYRKEAPENRDLVSWIETLVTTFLGYGYRRVHLALLDHGHEVSQYEVRKAMREHGLGLRKRKPLCLTRSDPRAEKFENLLRLFKPSRRDEIWVTDMTLIRTRTGPCYLAAILDLFSRKVVAWHLSRSPDLRLALVCLGRALESRRPAPGWIHHSDRGSVYTAAEYVARVRAAGGRLSMSRTATPTDNAYAESFFATLKKEEVRGNSYDSFLSLEVSLERFIDDTYNARRIHSSLGNISPDQFEAQAGEMG